MTTAQFSKRKALLFGVNTMKDNFGFFGVFFLVSLIISTVLYFVVLDLLEQNFVFGIVLYGACIALIILLSMGLVKTSLRFCDGEKGRYSDLYSQYKLIFKYFFCGTPFWLSYIWRFSFTDCSRN